MDFHSYPRQQMHTKIAHSLDENDDGDDVFYDELRRQVLRLTDEDDDVSEQVYENKILNRIQAQKLGPYNGLCGVRQPLCYYGWEDCAATPAWMLNLWRNGSGTGVFIPQTALSGRENRSRRKNERGRIYKRVERMN